MKNIFTLLAFLISLNAFSQNSNLIVFNNSGQQFFIVLNGIKQNSIPKTNVKIEGLAPTAYKVKIIFADGKTGDIDKNIYLEPNMEYSAQVVIKSPTKRSLKLFNMVALNTSPYGTGAETVDYRSNEGAVYSDQPVSSQPPVNQVTDQYGNPQMTSNGAYQNNSGQISTGNAGMQTNIDMNGQPMGTTGMNTSVTTTGPDGTSQTGNVQMNVGMTGGQNGGNMGVNQNVVIGENGESVVMDLQMNGTMLPDGTIISNGAQTTTNGTQTTTQTTTVNGQTTQVVTTTVTGNGVNNNPQASSIATHTDGTVHDHDHNVLNTTNSQKPAAGTHSHSDGTVHNDHQPSHGSHSDHNGNNNSNTTSGQAIVNANGTLTCNSALSDVDYLINGIKSESFSSDQIEYVKNELSAKCINSDQAYRIVNAFTFDGDRIQMSKFCYDHMTDKSNAAKLLDLFTFSSSKDELKNYFKAKK